MIMNKGTCLFENIYVECFCPEIRPNGTQQRSERALDVETTSEFRF